MSDQFVDEFSNHVDGISSEASKLPIKDNWSKEEAQWLLIKYMEYENEVGRLKRFSTKKALYLHLSQEFESVFNTKKTDQQISNRVQTIHRHRNASQLAALNATASVTKSRSTSMNTTTIGSIIELSPNALKTSVNVRGPSILTAAPIRGGSHFIRPSNICSGRPPTIIRPATGVVRPTSFLSNSTASTVRWSSIQIAPPNVGSNVPLNICAAPTSNTALTEFSYNERSDDISELTINEFPSVGENLQSVSHRGLDTATNRVSSTISSNNTAFSTLTELRASGGNVHSNGYRGNGGPAPFYETAWLVTASPSSIETSSSSAGSSTNSAARLALTSSSSERSSASAGSSSRSGFSVTTSSKNGVQSGYTEVRSSEAWTTEESRCLLDLYALYMNEIGPMKYFRTKNDMWEFVARKINSVFHTNKTLQQVSNRYKAIIRKKKDDVVRNRVSGATRSEVAFQEEIDKITSEDDSIEPEVLRGIDYVRYKEHKEDPLLPKKPRWDKPNKKGIINSLSGTMQEIEKRRAEREELKERQRIERHEEFMELLRSFKKKE